MTRFSLKRLLAVVALVAVGLFVGNALYNAGYVAHETAFGNGRMTRSQAETINGPSFMLDRLPDSEFLPEPGQTQK